MNTQADKTQENKSQSVASDVPQKLNDGESTLQFEDNRPEAIAQRKLLEVVNNSASKAEAAQLQAMADNSTRSQQPIQNKENSTGLPDNLKAGIENISGYSLDDVKVHYNSNKPAQLQAHAYAQGTDIHLASGQEKHLPHEAWHVVQQKQGRVKPTLQMKDKVKVNDDVGLEKEADTMGEKAMRVGGAGEGQPSIQREARSQEIVQRKVGVEYETAWSISGDRQHKKPIYEDSGWRIESDANNLEFVVEPPLNNPDDLKTKVAAMGAKAMVIRQNGGKTATQILGQSVKDPFKERTISKGGRGDDAMTAKAQFTFGISMENLTNFFDVLASGKLPKGSYPEASESFAFQKLNEDGSNQETNRAFLARTMKPNVEKSNTYRSNLSSASDDFSSEMKGFMSYFGYYLKSMEADYGDFTEKSKAAFLAQTILKETVQDKTISTIITDIGYPDQVRIKLFSESSVLLEKPTKISEISLEDKVELKAYLDARIEDIDYPKYRFTLMNRSGFDKMYAELPLQDRTWLSQNFAKVAEATGKSLDDHLFSSPYTYKTKDDGGDVTEKGFSHGSTLREWLQSIVNSVNVDGGRDALSPPEEFISPDGTPDTDQSMGSLGKMDTSITSKAKTTSEVIDVEKKLKKGKTVTLKSRLHEVDQVEKEMKQVVIELRQWGDWIDPSTWGKHSYDMAMLHNQISPRELSDSKYVTNIMESIAECKNSIEELKLSKRKVVGNKGQRQHLQNVNKGINYRIALLRGDIELLREKLP